VKKLLLALVLANLAFFGWQTFGRTKPVTGEPVAEPAPGQRLVLLSEVPATQRPAARAPLVPDELPAGLETPPAQETASGEGASGTPPSQPPTSCFHLAGFSSVASANGSKVALENAGATVGVAVAERFARTRYWVLLPPSQGQAQALAMVERLRQAGVRDYYLIPDGPNRSAVSLGVFSTKEAANRRLAEVARLKLKVRVEKVDYPGRRFALDVRWPGAAPGEWQSRVPPGIEITNPGCTPAP
jgi:hypothetical protein